MREHFASEVMKKSWENMDFIISGGIIRVFNTSVETMTDFIGGKNECIVKVNVL